MKLCGVLTDAVAPVASHITPVPGGVGPVTMLMRSRPIRLHCVVWIKTRIYYEK